MPGPSNFVGAVADALVSGHNAAASLWREGAGPAECELTTLEWVKRLTGLEGHADGVFASGGSVANMIGLAAARNDRLGEDTADAAVYCADQTHSCVARALRVLGFRADRLRTIATGDDCRLDPGRLRAAIERDRRAGSRPFCVVANAGTTNTGAVDDLHAVADLADEFGLWLHVDGAYGAAAALVPEGRALLAGMERADSVVIDPHKWLFQPYEAGVCLVREPGLLNRAFASAPEYLQDVAEGDGEVNFSERGLQLSRGLRAFKLWLSLKVFGADAFRQAVRRGLETAERAAAMLRETGRFEIVTGAGAGRRHLPLPARRPRRGRDERPAAPDRRGRAARRLRLRDLHRTQGARLPALLHHQSPHRRRRSLRRHRADRPVRRRRRRRVRPCRTASSTSISSAPSSRR